METKRLLCALLCVLLTLGSVTGAAFAGEIPAAEPAQEEYFTQWNAEAPALNALVDYVEAVTDPESPDYIPEMDRIAVFDMDGTLMGELYPTYLEYYMLAWRILKDPDCHPDAEMLEVGRLLRDCALDNSFPSDMAMRHAVQAARAYAGMTLNEFSDFVTRILVREVDGFEGMTYSRSFYLPMVEVVEYLQDNGFTCYVCSGSDRFICRVFIEGMVDIPYNNIIGMDVQLETTGQGGEAGLDHTFSVGENIVRTDKLLIKNLKTNKVLQIAQEIGQQPVLSFGNSSGDTSMHNYVIGNNVYKSAAFMLVADDDVRDYGNPEKAKGLKDRWTAAGYHVISMADDWKTIYGEDVVKTGEFRWMEELAENRVPVEQIVSYLGPAGTYTEEAAQFFFQNGEALTPKETVNDAIGDLVKGFSGYAVIPQENSIGGPVVNYVDALIGAEDVYVVGEVVLPICQTLMGVPGATLADITTVCSHAQGLVQSAQWRSEHLPDAKAEEMASTAAAAGYVQEKGDPSIAAVAAPGAAALYGLEVLAENVQLTDANKTRFYVLSKKPLEGEGKTRAVLVATCEANQIDDIIIRLHDAGLELVTLHDRPEGSALGSYHYVIEVENQAGITQAQLDAVRATDQVRFAGCFDAVEKDSAK